MRAVAVAGMLAGCQAPVATPGPVGAPAGPWREQTHMIPLTPDIGSPVTLVGRVCRPPGETPARLVVLAHGSPPVASARALTQLQSCSGEAVQWFLARGYVVVLSLRRGYGATAGPYAEGASECTVEAYVRSARASAQDVAATLAYGLALPYARPDGAVVVGVSAGGWAVIGLDSLPHPTAVALVSMAGGRGGHYGNRPDSNCAPENLAAAAGRLGSTASTPMLWIYTQNDSYFAPPIASAMHQAFVSAGGRAELHVLPAFGNDGHLLFLGRGGSLIWGELMENYLRERGAL